MSDWRAFFGYSLLIYGAMTVWTLIGMVLGLV
jgi:hypothetical protein